jgi:hypothetical protein
VLEYAKKRNSADDDRHGDIARHSGRSSVLSRIGAYACPHPLLAGAGELTVLLGQPIATTDDNRNVAWDLAPQRTSLTSRIGPFSLAAPDAAPRRFTVQLPNGSTRVVDVNGGAARQVQLVVNAVPGRNAVTITTQSDAVLIGEADRKSVFGKLIDLRASVTNPKIRLGVVQQRVE